MDSTSAAEVHWFVFAEADFNEFLACADDNTMALSSIISIEPTIRSQLCPSKWKVISDLVYQAFYFCKERKIPYVGTCLLVQLIEQELQFLATESSAAASGTTALDRMTGKVSQSVQSIGVPIATIKSVLEFFSDRFLKNIEAYRYVLHYYPDEVDKVVSLEIQTPTLPLPLGTAVPP